MRAGQADPVARAQEPAVAVHDLGREQPRADQVARAVEVGEDQVEQLGPLDDARSMADHSSLAGAAGPGRGPTGALPDCWP